VPPVPGKSAVPPTPGKGAVPPTPGKPGAAPAASAGDSKPAAAAPKPKPKAKVSVQTSWTPTELARRDWFLVTGWIVFTFSSLLATLFYVARYFFPNVTYESPLQFKAGPPTEFAPGRVDERFKETNGSWLVRNDLGLYALSTVCTHLGCTPNWLEGEQKFKCPCHGSGFRKTGINFEGPAPRPLERYRIVQADDGQVMVDKSQKFQFEKGEWENPESFLYV
jgi:cytochrome b6-f complex iron-sulfur subunit